MTAQVYEFTSEVTEFVIDIRNKGLGQFLEFGFDGTLGSNSIDIYRRFVADNGDIIAEVPMTFSAANQNPAQITQDQIAGLAFEGLIPESKLVFKASGGAVGKLILLGIS